MADNASGTQLLEMYRRMRLIRDFEELVQALFLKGEVHGTTHLYIGQEADAVGVASVLGEEDRLAGTYRGHGVALALGVDPQALLDEMLGRATGVCAGRAGSMNVVDSRTVCSAASESSAARSPRPPAPHRFPATGQGGVAVAFFGEGPPTRATSRNASTSPPCSGCRSSTSARTTSTGSSRRTRM